MALPKPVGRQSDVIYLPGDGHQVVLGTAGTGKTVMAVHRAAYLANPASQNHGRVLLLTYTNSLVTYLRHLMGAHGANVTVETYGKFGRGYLASVGKMSWGSIAQPDQRQLYVTKAIAAVRAGYQKGTFFDRPLDFFLDELTWIDGHGLQDLDAYLAAGRVGRMAPLQPSARQAIWKIRTEYQNLRRAAGIPYDWEGLSGEVRTALAADTRLRMYRHVVVDEAQDLSPDAIRSLAEAIQPGGSLTLFADYAQQIYGQRISWKSCGLSIKRAEPFTENYRNTAEIARLALAMAEMPHFKDTADIVAPTTPKVAGTRPTLVKCANEATEVAVVRAKAAELGQYARVGILTKTRAQARQASAGISKVRVLHDRMGYWDDSPGVYAGTYHSGKGLEFDVVLLPFCGGDIIPDPATVEAFGLMEASSRESRLLYVGVTRARTELLVTYVGKLTALLPPESSSLWIDQVV